MSQVCPRSGQYCKQKIMVPGTGKQRPCSTCRKHVTEARRLERAKKRNLSSSPPPAPSEDGVGEEVDLCRKDIVTATTTYTSESKSCSPSTKYCRRKWVDEYGDAHICSDCVYERHHIFFEPIVAERVRSRASPELPVVVGGEGDTPRQQPQKKCNRCGVMHLGDISLCDPCHKKKVNTRRKREKYINRRVRSTDYQNLHFFYVGLDPSLDQRLKCGVTHDCRQRLKSYRTPYPNWMWAFLVECGSKSEAERLERTFKQKYARQTLGGEWFDIPIYQVRKFLLKQFYTHFWDGMWRKIPNCPDAPHLPLGRSRGSEVEQELLNRLGTIEEPRCPTGGCQKRQNGKACLECHTRSQIYKERFWQKRRNNKRKRQGHLTSQSERTSTKQPRLESFFSTCY